MSYCFSNTQIHKFSSASFLLQLEDLEFAEVGEYKGNNLCSLNLLSINPFVLALRGYYDY